VQAILKKPSLVELSAFNKRKSFLPPQSLAFPLKWHPHMASVIVKHRTEQSKQCQKMMNCINKNIGVTAIQHDQPEIAGKNTTIHSCS
jgi:hypothetical protein